MRPEMEGASATLQGGAQTGSRSLPYPLQGGFWNSEAGARLEFVARLPCSKHDGAKRRVPNPYCVWCPPSILPSLCARVRGLKIYEIIGRQSAAWSVPLGKVNKRSDGIAGRVLLAFLDPGQRRYRYAGVSGHISE